MLRASPRAPETWYGITSVTRETQGVQLGMHSGECMCHTTNAKIMKILVFFIIMLYIIDVWFNAECNKLKYVEQSV